MTGMTAALVLPQGGLVPAAPRARVWSRPLRLILVLGGLTLGFWLLGLLFGSSSAHAAPHRPTTPAVTQRLDRTPAQLTGPVQRVTPQVQRTVTTTTAPLRATIRTAPAVLSQLGATVSTTVTRPVQQATPATTTTAPRPAMAHRVADRPVRHARHQAHHVVRPVAARAVAPVGTAPRPARMPSVAPSVHVNRPLASPAPAQPSEPAGPAAPQPSPAAPAAPTTAGAPDLSAVLPILDRPAAATGCAPAVRPVLVTGLRSEEPAFSPD